MARLSWCVFAALMSLAPHVPAHRILNVNETDLPVAFYDVCKADWSNCVGAWSKSELEDHGCFINKNCTYVVGFEPQPSGSYLFHAMAYNKTYVAFGFSLDQGMGDDGVVECIEDNVGGTTGINAYLSYNIGEVNYRETAKEGISLQSSMNVDHYLYCKIEVNAELEFPLQAKKMSLVGDKAYYLVAVSGIGKEDNGVIVGVGHHKGHAYSEVPLFSAGTAVVSSALLTCLAVLLIFQPLM